MIRFAYVFRKIIVGVLMGGIGSGRRWRTDARETTDDHRSIDVRYLHRKGLLTPGCTFTLRWSQDGKSLATIGVRTESDRVIVTYRHRGSEGWKDESYPIKLNWTPCNYGGKRPWCVCPAVGCGRRVTTLYLDGIFACRHCHNLAYPSQHESDDDRAARRAEKIREKLDWFPGLLEGRGGRPKGMHRKTYKRLVAEYDYLVAKSLTGIAARLNLSGESLDDLM
jgi:hypothetical protein